MSGNISVVTGGNGFIGSHLVPYLLGKGHEVRCIVRASSDLSALEGLDVHFHKCGLDDVGALATALEGARHVFHLAGTTRAKRYGDYLYGNVQLTRNVLEAARRTKGLGRVVLTSSLAASAPARIGQPVTEETPSSPISLYGKSKAEMERMVASDYADMPFCIVRPPVVYGPRDTEVLLFFRTVARGLVSRIGWGKKQVSLVYVTDLVRGLYLSATHSAALRQTYFFNSDTMPEWETIGRETAEMLGRRAIQLRLPHALVYGVAGIAGALSTFRQKAPTLNWEKAKEITQEAWTCSSEKAEKELGYRSEYPFSRGGKITLDWYKEAGWL